MISSPLQSSNNVPESCKPWFMILLADHFRRDLRSVVAQLSNGEVKKLLWIIERTYEPLSRLLIDWGLPPLECPGFWRGKVLPLLRARLLAPKQSSRRFNSSLFAKAKQATDVVEVASRFTALSPSGNRFRGLCPIHEESTPSFTVYPESQRWYCFGACGRGGDVVELVRELMEVDRWPTE